MSHFTDEEVEGLRGSHLFKAMKLLSAKPKALFNNAWYHVLAALSPLGMLAFVYVASLSMFCGLP